jgi:hypothetical protein
MYWKVNSKNFLGLIGSQATLEASAAAERVLADALHKESDQLEKG